MVTNNEAVENFLNGKRNLAAYQFSQLIKTLGTSAGGNNGATTNSNSLANNPSSLLANDADSMLNKLSNISLASATSASPPPLSTTPNDASPGANNPNQSSAASASTKQNLNCDEVAFNYAMVNLFTGCPQRASIIFGDLVKRYPRNPRLWLRLAESMLAAERSKMSEFENIQQLAYPHSRDHLIKTKNKPILIKINPSYCQQQIQQQFQTQRSTPSNFLVTIKGYLQKSLDLINEYNDISLLTDDISTTNQQASDHLLDGSALSPTRSPSMVPTNTSMLANSSSPTSLVDSLSSSRLSHHLSYSNPYQSIRRSALYHLRNKVQLNLAYICLCMGEPAKALTFTTQCLKSSPQGYEKVLASLYHAEACILASRVDEAIQFLNLEILNMAKSLSREHLMKTDETTRVVYGNDMQNQFDSGTLATVVTYNLSVAYAAKGEFNNAQRILMRCIQPTKPSPMQIILCLLYIQLQQGQLESARRTILNNLPQFR